MTSLFSGSRSLALLLTAVGIAAILVVAQPAEAGLWQKFRLGEVTVQAPGDWTVKRQVRNEEIDLKSPDGEYELLAFWWFPDEPILGHEDVVSAVKVVVDNRAATLVHSVFPELQVLQLVFDEPRGDMKQLVVDLSASSRDLTDGSPVFDDILKRLHFGNELNDRQPTVDTAAANEPVPDLLAPAKSDQHYQSPAGVSIGHPAAEEAAPGNTPETPADGAVAGENKDTAVEVTDTGTPDNSDSGEPAPVEVAYFDGTSLGYLWSELSVAGGDFARFAAFGNDGLVVDVPEGNGWGKTGIWSKEKIIAPGKRDDGKLNVTHFRFEFDPERTSSFVLALGPRDDPDEWWSHDLRFSWARSGDGTSGVAVLYVWQAEVYRLKTGPEAPDQVTISILGDGSVIVTLSDGSTLEAVMPGGLAVDGYHVYALAHAPENGHAAMMALRQIVLWFTQTMPRGVPPYPGGGEKTVLFEGSLGQTWVRQSAGGGDFTSHARLGGDGLVVNVPEGSSWGRTGILSPEPVVWLDGFNGAAEYTVEFAVDPARSRGFALSLAKPGYGGVLGNDPAQPDATFIWVVKPDGAGSRAEFHLDPQDHGDFWSQDGDHRAPATVRFILRPGEITLMAEGYEPVVKKWPELVEGASFHIYAYSIVPAQDAATSFALKSITLDRRGLQATEESRPAPGVEALPSETVFDGKMTPRWETAATAGGNFEEFATVGGQALIVDAPAGNSWAKTGLLSAEPLVRLDRRVRTAPTRLKITLDPTREQNLVVALSLEKTAEMWPSKRGWYSLFRNPQTGNPFIEINTSPYEIWTREIDPAWMDEHWNGELVIDIGNGWSAVSLPGGPIVRGRTETREGGAYYATFLAHAPKQGAEAHLALEMIETGVATPPGMTALDRWSLLDADKFDPERFLEDLSAVADWSVKPEIMR